MPEQRFFVIAGMSPREVQPRDGRPSFTVFEVFDDQGNTWRVREDLYNRATHWFGQRVVATTRTEQRGNFTNLYADQMEPAGAQPAGVSPSIPQSPIAQAQYQQTQGAAVTPAPVPTTGPIVSEWEKQKQRSIHRQTAAKVAAKLSSTPSEFWSNVHLIYQWFDTGVIPSEGEVSAVPVAPGRQNVQAYEPFNSDPGPQPSQARVDDDIPY